MKCPPFFGIVILMTFVATLRIYGIASRNFINTSMCILFSEKKKLLNVGLAANFYEAAFQISAPAMRGDPELSAIGRDDLLGCLSAFLLVFR